MAQVGFVGVHVGAGYHAQTKAVAYQELCKCACQKAIQVINSGESAVNAVASAVEVLENSPITNAGFGSNLTEEGTVECDAGIMDGRSLQFGGVGAISGIKNPINLAKLLLEEQCKGLQSLERIPPCILVGPAVRLYALKKNVQICPQDNMITDASFASYKNYKKHLNTLNSNTKKVRLEDVCNIQPLENETAKGVSDTVGAVVLDKNGNIAAAASSGGIMLKQPGRVGQAALFGCGCWAQNKLKDQSTAIACCTSGCGESLIKTFFARECALQMLSDDVSAICLKESIQTKFLESPFLRHHKEKQTGVLILKCSDSIAEFLWGHTTASMCIGYQSTSSKKPTSWISRQSQQTQSCNTILVEGTTIKL